MSSSESLAKVLVYGLPALAIVATLAGVGVFVASSGAEQGSQIAMATWGIGLLLVLQGLTTLYVVADSLGD